MPGTVPPVDDERSGLLGYLAQQRHVLRLCAHGLSDEQARLTPSASTLSVGGVVKHVAAVEEYWVDLTLGAESPRPGSYEENFRLGPDESLQWVLGRYADVAARTDREMGALDLAAAVPVPHDAPWFPKDLEAWSVRWVLLHLVTETARHAGHADIVRESIDGATAFPLMAAAEGWPETGWLKPWKPTGS